MAEFMRWNAGLIKLSIISLLAGCIFSSISIPVAASPTPLDLLENLHHKNNESSPKLKLVGTSPPFDVVYNHGHHKSEQQIFWKVIIFAFLGVTVTNLCAVTGIFCIPFRHSKHFDHLISFMMGIAASALFSAATLVLLPEALDLPNFPPEFIGEGRSYLLKLICLPAGVLCLYIFEYILLIIQRLGKEYPQVAEAKDDSLQASRTDAEQEAEASSIICKQSPCCPKMNSQFLAKIAPMAWVILLGDSIHNFMDGMAIAVAFSDGPLLGLTVTLCILFEELPHELGDFAVLITSGFSVRTAICVNFLSACSAYLGLVLGLLIGEMSSGILYVFAVLAGIFLHISLFDLMPDLRDKLKEAEKTNGSSLVLFFIQLVGLLTGFGCVIGVIFAGDHISF